MKTIGIVSSYSDICGIATYTKSLEKDFHDDGYHIEILELKQDFFHSDLPVMKKIADKELEKICSKIKCCDAINIQFEYGLFGINIKDIAKRVDKIIKACEGKTVVITCHTIPHSMKINKIFKNVIRFKFISACITLREYLENYKKIVIIKKLIKLGDISGGRIIVHTKRDKIMLFNFYGREIDSIIDFPLCYNSSISNKQRTQFEFKKEYNLKNEDKIIGVFGFLSKYKGISTIINSMLALPKNYHLFIFGGQHPSNIIHEPNGSEYVKELIKISGKNKLKNRIHFIGSMENHDDFIINFKLCDYIVLPYHEVGQSGSGIASLAIKMNESVYLSRNIAFIELNKYFKDSFCFFDIDNHMELAEKILHNLHRKNIGRKDALNKYNNKTNIKLYERALKIN